MVTTKKRNRAIVEYPTRLRPVRVYAPTKGCPYFSATWYEPGVPRQQRTTLGRVRSEAEVWAMTKAKSLTARQQSPHPDRPMALVGELVDAYANPSNHRRWSRRNATKVAHLCRVHLDEEFRNIVCEELLVDDLQRILNRTADAGRAASTVASVRTVLSGIVKFGHSRHFLLRSQNPMLGLETPQEQSVATFSGVDVKALPKASALSALASAMPDDNYRLMIELAAVSGMRFGELAALPWFNVRLNSRIIIIDRKLAEDTGGEQWIEAPKSRSARQAFYPESMSERMTACVEEAKQRAANGGLDVLFPSKRGEWLRRSNWQRRYWKRAHTAAGWKPEWTFHTLRHVAARDLIDALGDFDAAAILGHSDTNFTRRVYASAFEGAAERAARRTAKTNVETEGACAYMSADFLDDEEEDANDE